MKLGPKRNPDIPMNVGKMIKQVMFDRGINKARLSRRLGRNSTGIKRMIDRPSIQAYLIWELSVALGHNFFTDLAQQLDAATEGKLQQQQTELEQLKQEYERIKEERDYLKKAIDLLSSK